MLSTPRRRADALFTAVVLFYASTAVTTTTAQSANCVPFNSSSTAGYPGDVSIAFPTYFGCADGSFLTVVEGSYISYIYALSWTCSDLEEIGSFSSDTVGDGAVSFTVGITGVQTGATEGPLGFLADMHFGGYDVDEDEAGGISLSWKGPFGVFGDDEALLPGISASHCGSGAFATGATVWASSIFVYGVTLECATITDTCSPGNYPDSLLEGPVDSSTDESSSDSSTDGPSSDSSSPVIFIGVSVAGGLLLVAIAVGVTCCICHRRPSKTPHHETTRQIPAVGSTAANRNVQTAGRRNEGVHPAPSGPPPPYAEPPSCRESPPPAYA